MNVNIIRKKYACSLRLSNTCATGIRCVVHMLYMHSLEHLCPPAVTFSSYWCPQMKTSLVWNCHRHNEARRSPADSPVRAAASLLQKERNKTSLLQKERKKKLCRQKKKKATRRHIVFSWVCHAECVEVICIGAFLKDTDQAKHYWVSVVFRHWIVWGLNLAPLQVR